MKWNDFNFFEPCAFFYTIWIICPNRTALTENVSNEYDDLKYWFDPEGEWRRRERDWTGSQLRFARRLEREESDQLAVSDPSLALAMKLQAEENNCRGDQSILVLD